MTDALHDLMLGGLCMSRQEWDDMDEPSRIELLRVLIETSPPRVDDDAYESYELVVGSASLA